MGEHVLSTRPSVAEGMKMLQQEDLWDEIENGNLFAKLQELSQYPHAFFLVDKPITEVFKDIKKKVFYKPRLTSAQKIAEYNRRKLRLFGAIASCSLRGFPPIFCSDRREAAELIVRMYYKARDSKDRSEVVATRPTATHKDRAMRVLLSYPFIGDKTAEKLLEKYGSVGEVNQALLNLFEKPNKKLMRELGLNRKQLDNAVAILVGDVD